LLAISAAIAIPGILTSPQSNLLFAIFCAGSVLVFLLRVGVGATRATAVAVTLAVGAVLAQIADPGVVLAPFLVVVLINATVAYVFARGLMPGRQPLILQIVRLLDSGYDTSPEFRHFVVGQCWIWVGLTLLTSLSGLVAMLVPEHQVFTGITTASLVMLQIAWFVLSHEYANRRYGRPETWMDTLRVLSRPGVWTKLEF
jgi:hypothetical protein